MSLFERGLRRVSELPIGAGPLFAVVALWVWSLRLRTGRVCEEIGVYLARTLKGEAPSPLEQLLVGRDICFRAETELTLLAYSLALLGVSLALVVGLRRRPGHRLTRVLAYGLCGGILGLLVVYRFIVIV